MIVVYIMFCGLLAVALLMSLFFDCAHQTDKGMLIEYISPLRLTGGGYQCSSTGSQKGDSDEESVGDCSLENVKCTSIIAVSYTHLTLPTKA